MEGFEYKTSNVPFNEDHPARFEIIESSNIR
jgi:hypothetical protein